MNLEHGKYGVCAIRWNLDWFVNNEYYGQELQFQEASLQKLFLVLEFYNFLTLVHILFQQAITFRT